MLPALAVLAVHSTLVIEDQYRTRELASSYPVSRFTQFGIRAGLVAATLLLVATGSDLLMQALGFPIGLWTALQVAGPPTVFLLGVTWLASSVSGNGYAGVGAGLAYVGVDWFTQGQLTQTMFLLASLKST